MGYDDILRDIGEFGRYQKGIFFLASLCTIFAPLNVISQIFLATESDHWCHVDLWTNCTCADNYCKEWTKNLTIPVTEEGTFDQCYRYDVDPVQDCDDIPDPTEDTIPCDDGWEYDRSQYKSTIITDFDLVCGRDKWINIAQTVYFAGILVGAVAFGGVTDRFGRRMGILATLVCTGVSGALVVASQSVIMYTITRFLLGASAHNTFLTAFVVVSELVGPSKRVLTGITINYFFALGIMILPILAYFIRYWRILQLAITLPGFVMLAFLLVIPESPRWLMSRQRWEAAFHIIRKTARFNGAKITEEALEEMADSERKAEKVQTDDCSLVQLLKIPTMRLRTLSLLFNWGVQSFVYYGLTFATPSLGVNIYLSFIISGAVEIIGYTLDIYLLEKFGRRLSLSGLLTIVGISCLLVAFTPGVCKFVFGMVGKTAISATFGLIFVYTAELYPTPIRGVVVGIGSMSSRAAAMVCPAVILLSDVWPPLPITLFAATGLIAAALTLILPETKGIPLPETMLEAQNLGSRIKHTRVPTYEDDEKLAI